MQPTITRPAGALKFDLYEQWPNPHAQKTWETLAHLKKLAKSGTVTIDGTALDAASVVASARYGCKVSAKDDEAIRVGINGSVNTLQEYLSKGYFLYVLGPKEGLSLINGTAAAAAVATLGLFEANQLAVLSQVLTAMSSEALYANAEWAHPFIAAVRPRCGQIEAAQNVRTFLQGSKLVYGLEHAKDRFKAGLV
ncbi:L-Aspartase-like protein [Lasiosphaeris hirsuta]|uniref:L-Aspartase-like protein n=1 Tax=Lasiosphaeris hirsuta TaxID=260670 RepID=A0AA40DT64_9PEZI|nr:L-Aspartase-like protein [Lasiosphaeris hirsuta]